MRALLVVHDVYQEDNRFPLWAGYLASILRHKGVDVHIYSADIFHYPNSHLADYLAERKFDIIGLSFLASRFKETIIPLCKVINKHKKKSLFLLGGHGVYS